MNPSERAESIFLQYMECGVECETNWDELQKVIASHIAGAILEAIDQEANFKKAKDTRYGMIKAYEYAAEKIEASVNIKGINTPSVSIINCHLQSRFDAEVCRELAKELKENADV